MATRWRPQITMPVLLTRGVDSYVELEVWGPDGLQQPTSGTLSVYDEDDALVVDAQAISVDTTTKRAYTTVLAASLPSTLDFSDSWRAAWVLSLAGESATVHQDAQLIQRPWRATITPRQVVDASPQLRSSFDLSLPADVNLLDGIIQSAVESAQGRLVGAGRRPWLIFDPWRLNAYVVQVVLARVYRSHLFDGDPANFAAHDKLATHHEEAAESAWAGMNFRYDDAQTGAGGDVKQAAGPATIRVGMTR